MMLRRTKVERVDELGLPPRVVFIRRDLFNDEEMDFYRSLYADSATTFASYVQQGTVLNHYAHIFVSEPTQAEADRPRKVKGS